MPARPPGTGNFILPRRGVPVIRHSRLGRDLPLPRSHSPGNSSLFFPAFRATKWD